MDPLLSSIRRDPLSYLPEVSLRAFGHFRNGYAIRSAMEGKTHDWQYDPRKYWEWLADRFHLEGAGALNDISIVSSFSATDIEAFHRYFELLDEFVQEGHPRKPPTPWKSERRDFAGMMRALRERPAMYLGCSSFRALHCFLSGDEHAFRDLGLPADESRATFESFKRWVELTRNKALPRPWFKVIEFWSMGIDCGHNPKSGALSLFFSWLDQYAKEIGEEELFAVKPKPNESP
jgi:hypothetical protein